MHRTLPSAVAAGLAVAALTLLPAGAVAQTPQKTDTVKSTIFVTKKADSTAKKTDTVKVSKADSARVIPVKPGTETQIQVEQIQITPGSSGLQGVLRLEMVGGTGGAVGGIKLSSDSAKKAGAGKPDSTTSAAKGKSVEVKPVEVKPAESKSPKPN